MRTILLVGICALSGAAFAQGKPADWKIYGFAGEKGHETDMFYSASEVTRNAAGNVEVWTKGLAEHRVAHARETMDEATTVRVVQRAVKYVLPYARIKTLSTDQMLASVSSEEIANEATIEPDVRIMYEL